MTRLARLLLPALRWHDRTGFEQETGAIDRALDLGVGGFCLFGGEAASVRELTAELRSRSPHQLLIGADLERGAGQQFDGAVALPPLAAIGAIDDLESTRRAASLTAREALALGVNWLYAPVADVDIEPRNPIVGTRAFGSDPDHVSRHVAAWIEGCRAEGVLCCAKHFPGHGRTTIDSHAALPQVEASVELLETTDLVPFRAAVRAGVDAIMTAHVTFPALDASAVPATMSPAILTELLRGSMGFKGLVVTDALIMEGAKAGVDEAGACVRAVAAGCDALLYPDDVTAAAAALESAAGREVSANRVNDALSRVAWAADHAPTYRYGPVGAAADHAWAIDLGARAVVRVRGFDRLATSVDVVTLDDDLGGPYPPPARDAFPEALRASGFDVRENSVDPERTLLVAVYSDIRGWKGRPGLSSSARIELADIVERRPDAHIVLFGHRRLAGDMPGEHILAAWGGEPVMQRAAAKRLRELGGA